MKRSLLNTFCAAGLFISGNAIAGPVTLTWSAQEAGSALCQNTGTPLALGSKVRLGYFDLEPEQIRPLFTNPSALDGHFTELASANIGNFEAQTFVGTPELNVAGTTYSQAAGCFAASVVFTPSVNAATVDGKRCYIWAMNGSSLASATQHGIFSSHLWVLNSQGFGNTNWDLSQVSASDPTDLLLGGRGPQVSAVVGGTVLRLTDTSQLKADEADDDHDGASGLLESAFSMNPAVADNGKLPQIEMKDGIPCFQFSRKPSGTTASDGSYAAGGFRYQVEISPDLKQWQVFVPAANMVETTPDPETGSEKVCLHLSGESLPEGFIFARVRVERTPWLP